MERMLPFGDDRARSGPRTKARCSIAGCGIVSAPSDQAPPDQSRISRSSVRALQRWPVRRPKLASISWRRSSISGEAERRGDERDGVGVAAARRSDRVARDDRARVDRLDIVALQRGERGEEHGARIAEPDMAPVRPEADGIEGKRHCVAHRPRAYRRCVEIDSPLPGTEPPRDCPRCPRLIALRRECQIEHPDWWNAPVYAFGDPDAWLAFAGLAPGKHGANRTGRPFTGDCAGDLLFATLAEFGLSKGRYDARIDGGLDARRRDYRQQRQMPARRRTSRSLRRSRIAGPFSRRNLRRLPNVRVIIALGRIAHDATLWRAVGVRLAACPFAHGAVHALPDGRHLADSYHCSRYNTNTGRLTPEMFADVFRTALGAQGSDERAEFLDQPAVKRRA